MFVSSNKIGEHSFSRRRKILFKDLIISLMSFTRPSVQTELDRFYKAISKSGQSFETVSKSAFTQSRKKLDPAAFIELSRSQLDYFDQHAPVKKHWKNNRVVAIDGSLLNLPHNEDVKQEFGSVKNQYEDVISGRCSFAYDVCNELVLDAQIAPRRSCEKDLAVEHLKQLDPEKDILVFDRGYPSQWLMGLLSKEGFKFCFRLSTAWKKAHELMQTQNDMDWTLVRGADREWGKLKDYGLSKTLEGLRLASFPLKGGEKEVLVTNLTDREAYDLEDLKALYNLRWGVEESYKSFKKVLHIESFSGRTPLAIKQDFFARVFMLNMASIIRTQGVSTEKKSIGKHKKKVNKTQSLAKTKDFLADIFYSKSIKKPIAQLLGILEKRQDIERLNRSFIRPKTSSRRRNKIMNLKGI